jgi:hypothetical protein
MGVMIGEYILEAQQLVASVVALYYPMYYSHFCNGWIYGVEGKIGNV